MTMSSSAMPLSTTHGLSGDKEGGTATVPVVTTHMMNSNTGLGIWRQGKGRKRQWNVFLELLEIPDMEEEMQFLEQRAVCQDWDTGEQSKKAWPAVP